MKPSILSIGNATHDIYLEIGQQELYKDENNNFHYDLTFDDSTLEYKRVAGVFGGVVLSDRIFNSAHLKSFSSVNPRGAVGFSAEKDRYDKIERYIISSEGRSFVLASNSRDLQWVDPIYTPSSLFIADANFSPQYLDKLKNYIKTNPKIDVGFSLNDFEGRRDLAKLFLSRASLVFVDFARPVLTDLIDFSSFESVSKSLFELGVKTIAIQNGQDFIAANQQKIAKISTNFKLNSFYQNSIFRTAFAAENYSSSDIEQSLQVAAAIANNSNFNDIVKPLYARQIIRREQKNYQTQIISEAPNLEQNLQKIAKQLVARPKGIFAADESGGNIHKKFEDSGIEDTAENRRRYREMLLTTPDIENYLSGVILFEETVEQSTSGGVNFVDYLKSRGLLVGVKLDEGLQPLIGFGSETTAKGLENLEQKLQKYSKKGINFAKWRVAFAINQESKTPSLAAIATNVQILARYAKACQSYGIVPIVEPEVIFDGNHSTKDCRLATGKILLALIEELKLFEVDLAGTIIKTNMVMAGKTHPLQSSPREVGLETANILRKTLPKELAGVVFLSGGQTPQQATDNLQAITNAGPYDWGVSYSYARALQEPALKAWQAKDENVRQAQLVFLERVAANSHALYKN